MQEQIGLIHGAIFFSFILMGILFGSVANIAASKQAKAKRRNAYLKLQAEKRAQERYYSYEARKVLNQ